MHDEAARIRSAEQECEREPVHVPGAIQPCGALIALDAAMTRVVQVSANAGSLLGLDIGSALGAECADALPADLLQRVRQGLCASDPRSCTFEHDWPFAGTGRLLHVQAYVSSGRVVLEFEPEADVSARERLAGLRHDIDRLADLDDPAVVLTTLVDAVRGLTGHQRVMVYVFDEDWHGRVVAESVAEGAARYLDHRFPASDIPPQVRALYSVNRVRSIPDAGAQAVPLRAIDAPCTAEPLDLSRGMLRAAAPVHCAYLANMGVGASMSVALHRDGRLWGLVACHHDRPWPLPPAVRHAAAALAQAGAQRLFLLEAAAAVRYRALVQQQRLLLRSALELGDGPAAWLEGNGQRWLDLLRSSGIAMVFGDGIATVGTVPAAHVLRQITGWLEERVPARQSWVTRALRLEAGAPDIGDFAGVVAVPLRADPTSPGWLLILRREEAEQVRWAGQPVKHVEERAGRAVLSPRASFESWVEEVREHCAPWPVEVVAAAQELGEDLALIHAAHRIDQLARTVAADRSRLEALATELQRSNQELESFAYVASHDLQEPLRKISAFSDRLRARAHGLDDTAQDYLQRMSAAAARMQALIGGLLEYSRVGKAAPALLRLPLHEVVDDALKDLELAVSESGAQIRCAALPCVRGDSQQLKRLFQNLIGNAIKYRRTDALPEISVTATECDGRVIVELSDNGIGIDPQDAGRMFLPFVRLANGTPRRGTGIGLAISRKIVETHGGTISACGVPGAGTTIRIELPGA